jgi:hypothetical protein
MGEFCVQHRRVERHSAQSVTMRMVTIAIVLAQGTAALGETLTCSARLHIRTCQGPGGGYGAKIGSKAYLTTQQLCDESGRHVKLG